MVVEEGRQTYLGVGDAGWASTMRTGTFLAGAGAMGLVGVAAGTVLALGPADLCTEKAPGLCDFLRESWSHSQLSATHEQGASRRLSKIFSTKVWWACKEWTVTKAFCQRYNLQKWSH